MDSSRGVHHDRELFLWLTLKSGDFSLGLWTPRLRQYTVIPPCWDQWDVQLTMGVYVWVGMVDCVCMCACVYECGWVYVCMSNVYVYVWVRVYVCLMYNVCMYI